jgi:hypothetical protein
MPPRRRPTKPFHPLLEESAPRPRWEPPQGASWTRQSSPHGATWVPHDPILRCSPPVGFGKGKHLAGCGAVWGQGRPVRSGELPEPPYTHHRFHRAVNTQRGRLCVLQLLCFVLSSFWVPPAGVRPRCHFDPGGSRRTQHRTHRIIPYLCRNTNKCERSRVAHCTE